MLKIGDINKLKVIKETDIAYMLSDGETSVFLHFNQTPNKLSIGEEVNAFLYYDQKKRLCATLEEPLITINKPAFLKVVALNEAGVFVNMGISKDLLVSKDYLPTSLKLWPRVSESIPVILKVKATQLVGQVVIDALNNTTLELDQQYEGIVSSAKQNGFVVVTSDFNTCFIPKALTRQTYHLGEVVSFKVKEIKEKQVIGTMIQNKEIERLNDSDIILSYLKNMGGAVNLGNNAKPEDIYKVFHMSKSAYKRAIGHLYKLKLINIYDDYIELIKK